MKKFGKLAAMVLASGILVAALAGCEKGPAEKAGKAIDNAADKTGQQIDRVADKIEDTAKDLKK